MVNEQFIHLLPPPASKWAKARRIGFWALYCVTAVIVSFCVATISENFWQSIFTIATFIFGPKLWRRLR